MKPSDAGVLSEKRLVWVICGWLGALLLVGADALGALLRSPLALGSPTLLLGAFASGASVLILPSLALAWLMERGESLLAKLPRAYEFPPPGVVCLALVMAGGLTTLFAHLFQRVDPTELEFTAPAWLTVGFGVFLTLLSVGLGTWLVAQTPSAKRWVQVGSKYRHSVNAIVVAGLAVATVALIHWGPDAYFNRSLNSPAAFAALGLLIIAARLAASGVAKSATIGARRWLVVLLPGLTLVIGLLASLSPGVRFLGRTRLPLTTEAFRLTDGLVDWDRDGSTPTWLGGCDCAPFNREIAPGTIDRAGDGVDQDCQGGDRPQPVEQQSSNREQDSARAPHPWEACLARFRSAERPPNVLLLTVDALRLDTFQTHAPPEFVALAERSAQFTRAYAPSSRTYSSVPALFAGTWVADLARDNFLAHPELVARHELLTALRQAGYRTEALSMLSAGPLGDGFDSFGGASSDPPAQGGGKFDYYAGALSAHAARRLARLGEHPLFLWVHHADTHAPHVPISRHALPEPKGSNYERSVAYTLLRTAELLRYVQRSERRRDTIVIFSADHGEELGERGRHGHGSDLVEAAIRVPLLFHVPGCPPRFIRQPVSLVELAPALADLTGVGKANWSLLDTIAERPRPLPVVVESLLNGRLERAVIDGNRKLRIDVGSGGRVAFDLERDPLEQRNVYGDQVVAERLEAAYQRWLDRSPLWVKR